MASLYKNKNVWYLSIYHHGKRITKSLKTNDLKVAKALKPIFETSILKELIGFKESSLDLPFPELVGRFLKTNHSWSSSTYELNKYILTSHLKNARFHDLRRTFGLNLIKQGMSIYKVSKLLGHKSVRTTEQHYAPLLTVEIEDFTL